MVQQDQVSYWIRQGLPKLLKLQQQQQQQNEHTSSSHQIMDDIDVVEEILANYQKNVRVTSLCSLWSGMGHIYKITIQTNNNSNKQKTSSSSSSSSWQFVVKQVEPRPQRKGQHRSLGDRRKADSYQVEANFYDHLANTLQTKNDVVLPSPLFVERGGNSRENENENDKEEEEEVTIGMSFVQGNYMDSSQLNHIYAVLSWLAKFHSSYWGNDTMNDIVTTVGIQPIASYWHLNTRPDEYDSMSNNGWEGRLKLAARAIDTCLKRDSMQCLVHGDVKDANIMIQQQQQHDNNNDTDTTTTTTALLYDFQYCGKGPPTIDLAYFFCSSLDVSSITMEKELVTYYHTQLVQELAIHYPKIPPPTLHHLQQSLHIAYCDYCRFMAGWGYWGSTDITKRVQSILNSFDNGCNLGSEDAYEEVIRSKFW